MEIKDLCGILEDRYTELSRLTGADMSISIDWYDGAKNELKRTIKLLKRHLTSSSSRATKACGYYTNIHCLLRLEDCGKHCPRYLPPAQLSDREK